MYWQYRVPVRLRLLEIPHPSSAHLPQLSMRFTLDSRNDLKTWQDNASLGSTVNYPILGPKATIGIGANMSLRNVLRCKNKSYVIRLLTFDSSISP